MKVTPSHFKEALLPTLGKTNKLLHFYINEKFKLAGVDLRKEQAILLNLIHSNDGLIQNELCFFTNRDKTSLTRLIQSLEKKELILRKPLASDKRKNQVFLTEAGSILMKKIIPILKNAILELEEGITKEEKELVKRILAKMKNNISNKSNVAIPTNFE